MWSIFVFYLSCAKCVVPTAFCDVQWRPWGSERVFVENYERYKGKVKFSKAELFNVLFILVQWVIKVLVVELQIFEWLNCSNNFEYK